MTQALTSALIILAAAVVPPRPCAPSCRCARYSPAEMVAHADLVFVGEVTALRTPPEALRSQMIELASLRVVSAIKGDSLDHVLLPSGAGPDCLLPFRLGERYLVFVQPWQGMLSTSSCAGTISLDSEPGKARLAEVMALPRQ